MHDSDELVSLLESSSAVQPGLPEYRDDSYAPRYPAGTCNLSRILKALMSFKVFFRVINLHVVINLNTIALFFE